MSKYTTEVRYTTFWQRWQSFVFEGERLVYESPLCATEEKASTHAENWIKEIEN